MTDQQEKMISQRKMKEMKDNNSKRTMKEIFQEENNNTQEIMKRRKYFRKPQIEKQTEEGGTRDI